MIHRYYTFIQTVIMDGQRNKSKNITLFLIWVDDDNTENRCKIKLTSLVSSQSLPGKRHVLCRTKLSLVQGHIYRVPNEKQTLYI